MPYLLTQRYYAGDESTSAGAPNKPLRPKWHFRNVLLLHIAYFVPLPPSLRHLKNGSCKLMIQVSSRNEANLCKYCVFDTYPISAAQSSFFVSFDLPSSSCPSGSSRHRPVQTNHPNLNPTFNCPVSEDEREKSGGWRRRWKGIWKLNEWHKTA